MEKDIKETKILEGKSIAASLIDELDKKIGKLKSINIHPHLAVILIGNNEASQIYVNLKEKRAKEIGIDFSLYKFNENMEEDKIIELVEDLNSDPQINGIIIQLPLPENFNTDKILSKIDPKKDVDALISKNFESPTVMAIWKLIEFYNLPTDSILIIGKGKLVGAPLKILLNKKKLNSTQWGSKDFDEKKISKYSLIICATGQKGLIKKHLPLESSYLIDASGKDVDFDVLYDCVSGLTPPVGGVGPLTIAYLLKNTIESSEKQNK